MNDKTEAVFFLTNGKEFRAQHWEFFTPGVFRVVGLFHPAAAIGHSIELMIPEPSVEYIRLDPPTGSTMHEDTLR